MDKTYQAPQGRLLPTLVLLGFFLGLLYTAFLLVQQVVLKREVSRLESQRLEVEGEIELLREQQLEELFVAQELKDLVQANAIKWSAVVKSLKDITPVTVFFSSYSAGTNGAINVSGLGDSYAAVADLITALEKSSDFSGVFVPSLTLGSTRDGQEVVSFSLEVQTVKQ